MHIADIKEDEKMGDMLFGLMYIAIFVGGLAFLMGVCGLILNFLFRKSPAFVRFCEWILGVSLSEEPPVSGKEWDR